MNKIAIALGLVGGLALTAQAQKPAETKKAEPAKAEPAKPAAKAEPAKAEPAKPGAKAEPAKPGAGTAAAGAPAEPPPPPKPGPETLALKPFSSSASWTGKVPAGAYGNNPEMASKGKATCKWILENLWVACEIDDHVGTGKQAMNYKGHMVYGWDFGAKEYRSTMTDNFGNTSLMKGKLEGAKLSFESATESFMMGQPTKFRITFDATEPKAIKFTGEHTVAGKWIVDEENVMKPVGK